MRGFATALIRLTPPFVVRPTLASDVVLPDVLAVPCTGASGQAPASTSNRAGGR